MYYIKLTNGDDLVADISKNTKGDFTTLINPFKMNTKPMITNEGVIDTLALSSWLHPYSEDTDIRIMKSSIVTIVPASIGLKTFYKKQLANFEKTKSQTEPKENWEVRTRKIEENIPNLSQDEYDDYMDEMEEFQKIKKRMYN